MRPTTRVAAIAAIVLTLAACAPAPAEPTVSEPPSAAVEAATTRDDTEPGLGPFAVVVAGAVLVAVAASGLAHRRRRA